MRKDAHAKFPPPTQPEAIPNRIFPRVLKFHYDPQPPQPPPPPQPLPPSEEPPQLLPPSEELEDEDESTAPHDVPHDAILLARRKGSSAYANGVAASAPTPKTAAHIASSADALPGLNGLTCVLNPE